MSRNVEIPNRPRRRRAVRLATLGCALAVALAGVAFAAHPKPGTVLTGTARGGSGGPAYDLTFKVKSENTIQKVIAIRQGKAGAAGKGNCLAPDNFSFKHLKVDSDGSFKDRSVGYMYKANITGKFKSAGKATGTVHACTPGLKFTVKK